MELGKALETIVLAGGDIATSALYVAGGVTAEEVDAALAVLADSGVMLRISFHPSVWAMRDRRRGAAMTLPTRPADAVDGRGPDGDGSPRRWWSAEMGVHVSSLCAVDLTVHEDPR